MIKSSAEVIMLIRNIAYTLIVALLVSLPVSAKEPAHVVEWGVGLGGQHLNDYRGSKETQTNALPFPIIVYHGDFLKVDEEEGIRAELLQSKRFEINLSGDSALRSSTDENKLRAGMERLDTAFQLGPSFNMLLAGNDFDNGLALRFPIRVVMTLDTDKWSMDYIGYTINPELTYKKQNILPNWNLKMAAGPIYGSQKYHEYYYGIADEYVTEIRSAYKAKAGYSGTFYEAGLFGRYENWMFQFGVRYDNLSNAKFLGSDLVETKNYFSVGFGVGWMFHTSRYQ